MLLFQKTKSLLLTALILILTACASGPLEQPRVRLSNITPKQMTLFEQQYEISLRIQNPNNQSLSVTGMNYKIILNDKEFAQGVSNKNFVVPALGEHIIQLLVTSSPLDWIRQLGQFNSGSPNGLSYSLEGKLFLKNYAGKAVTFSKSETLLENENN